MTEPNLITRTCANGDLIAIAVSLSMLACASARREPAISADEFTRRVASYPPLTVERAETMVRDGLKDPYSARFTGMLRSNSYPSGVPCVCGWVNGKNVYGAYVGARRFVATPMGAAMEEAGNDRAFSSLWKSSCSGLGSSKERKTPVMPALRPKP